MQHNFILTDVMKTGNHIEIESFINMHSMDNQKFDVCGEYYGLDWFDLDSYHRKFAMVDCRNTNLLFEPNTEFKNELQKRLKILRDNGFSIIMATPRESLENISMSHAENQHTYDKVYPTKEMIGEPCFHWTGGTSWFWFYMQNKHKNRNFNFTHDHNGSYWHKKKDFLYLNKAPRQHRKKLYTKLKDNHCLDNSIHSFTLADPPVTIEKEYELPGLNPKNYPRFGKDQDIYELPYIDTVCSIVSETNDNDFEVFMTEKIWKPIIAKHVFVVHGNYLYLQKLKEIGFRTFNNYFDESYDLERDPDKRINKIAKLIADLKEKCDGNHGAVEGGNKKWQDIYLQTQALRTHNYETFFSEEKLSKDINKVLDLFLEFADTC
jgi:hypothetical protein